jgi:hypothetical protein
MLSGSAKCIEEIADREGCSPRNMTLSLAFLAPEIVKAAIDGRLPRGVGISRLSDLGANSSDSLESPHPRRIDAYVPRTATESQRGEDRDGVERSGDRDFSAQISHTQPSGSMVRVLIAGSGAKHPVLAPSAGSTWSLDFSHGALRTIWPFCLCPQKSLFLGNGDRLDQRLVREWTYERSDDGKKGEPCGGSPKGVISKDSHLSLFQSRAEIPKIAANDRAKATAEEAQRIVAFSIAYYSTYSVDENSRVMVVNLAASTYANTAIPDQKR